MDGQEEVVAFLSNPANWGDAGSPALPIRTHGSYVFIGRERVLKMKRAVRFDYMDFGSLERRRACCEAEVTLNRRTAPRLYLRAVPVTREPAGGLALAGAGEPIEWVVEMRRFQPQGLFDRMAAQGSLTAALIERLADHIHRFHDVCEVRFDHGGADEFRHTVEVSLSQCAGFAGETLEPVRVAALRERLLSEVERRRGLLETRRAAGFVRYGHGDLHLGNVCLDDGEPTLFDCIEFNEEFAVTDLLYDFAFLVMDLIEHRLGVLANIALSRYLAYAQDLSQLALMPLFLAVRASIRCHVCCATAAIQQDTAAASQLRARAKGYLELALALLKAGPTRLIAIGGLSGSGKTTLARAIAPLIGAPPGAVVLRSDEVRKAMLGLPLDQPAPPEVYARSGSDAVYAELRRRAGEALQAGAAVIVDAVHAQVAERECIAGVAAKAGVPFTGLWLEAPAPVMAGRIAGRRGDASDATAQVLDRQLTYDLGPIAWQRFAAGGDLATLVESARAHLALR